MTEPINNLSHVKNNMTVQIKRLGHVKQRATSIRYVMLKKKQHDQNDQWPRSCKKQKHKTTQINRLGHVKIKQHDPTYQYTSSC